jgi:ATP-dependent Clp protease ATP-binding subunit ClpA
MFERFTDEARRVIVRAQEVASEHSSASIGIEHLLRALADDPVLEPTMREHGLGAPAIDTLIPDGTGEPRGHLPFTKDAKRALEGSLRESLKLGSGSILPGHLLLAILSLTSPQVVSLVEAGRGNPEWLRAAVVELIPRREATGTEGMTASMVENVSYVQAATRAIRSKHPAANAPKCPGCSIALTETLKCQTVRATDSDAELRIFFCGSCGHVVHTD